jgi:hypothetical protein
VAEPDDYYRQFCMSQKLRVNNPADVATVRAAALDYTFSGTLPSTGADTIATGVSAFSSTTPGSNCASIDLWTFAVGSRLAFAYVYHPAVTPATVGNKFALCHHGHESAGFGVSEAVKACVDAGIHTAELFMPGGDADGNLTQGCGPNTTNHDCATGAELGERYLSPSIRTINQAVSSVLGTQGVGMTGISGGGWTTHHVAALDTRIRISYPCSGAYPLSLRNTGPNQDVGDVEQNDIADGGVYYHDATNGNNPAAVSYLDLFALGACGVNRKQVQCLNALDVHFGFSLWKCYENMLRNKVAYCGGNFSVREKATPASGHSLWPEFAAAFVSDMTVPAVRGRSFARGR